MTFDEAFRAYAFTGRGPACSGQMTFDDAFCSGQVKFDAAFRTI
jgi:hypothetical protein